VRPAKAGLYESRIYKINNSTEPRLVRAGLVVARIVSNGLSFKIQK